MIRTLFSVFSLFAYSVVSDAQTNMNAPGELKMGYFIKLADESPVYAIDSTHCKEFSIEEVESISMMDEEEIKKSGFECSKYDAVLLIILHPKAKQKVKWVTTKENKKSG